MTIFPQESQAHHPSAWAVCRNGESGQGSQRQKRGEVLIVASHMRVLALGGERARAGTSTVIFYADEELFETVMGTETISWEGASSAGEALEWEGACSAGEEASRVEWNQKLMMRMMRMMRMMLRLVHMRMTMVVVKMFP